MRWHWEHVDILEKYFSGAMGTVLFQFDSDLDCMVWVQGVANKLLTTVADVEC